MRVSTNTYATYETYEINKDILIENYQKEISELKDRIHKDEIYEEKLCDEIEQLKGTIELLQETVGEN